MRLMNHGDVLDHYHRCVAEVVRKYKIEPVTYDKIFNTNSIGIQTVIAIWNIGDATGTIMVSYTEKNKNYTLVFNGMNDGRVSTINQTIHESKITDNDFLFPMVLTGLGQAEVLLPELFKEYEPLSDLEEFLAEEKVTVIGPDYMVTFGGPKEEPTSGE